MWKQIYHVNTNQNKVCIAVLTSNKVNFKIGSIKRLRELFLNDIKINSVGRYKLHFYIFFPPCLLGADSYFL